MPPPLAEAEESGGAQAQRLPSGMPPQPQAGRGPPPLPPEAFEDDHESSPMRGHAAMSGRGPAPVSAAHPPHQPPRVPSNRSPTAILGTAILGQSASLPTGCRLDRAQVLPGERPFSRAASGGQRPAESEGSLRDDESQLRGQMADWTIREAEERARVFRDLQAKVDAEELRRREAEDEEQRRAQEAAAALRVRPSPSLPAPLAQREHAACRALLAHAASQLVARPPLHTGSARRGGAVGSQGQVRAGARGVGGRGEGAGGG